MPSINSDHDSQAAEKTALLLVAIALNMLELFIPRIPLFPWLKPGIANVVTIVWIIRYGTVDALLFSLLRVWIAGFYAGFSFLTLSLALSGGVISTLAMGIVWKIAGKRGMIGTIGLGIIGAFMHNTGQLAAVFLLVAHNFHLLYQMPLMILASILFGGIVGALAPFFLSLGGDLQENRVPSAAAAQQTPSSPPSTAGPATKRAGSRFAVRSTVAALILAGCCCIAFVDDLAILISAGILATVLSQIAVGGSGKALWNPLRRFWPLFFFIGVLDLFFSYGQSLGGLPFVTREGLESALVQWLRLWTWLQLSSVFTRLRFHESVIAVLRFFFAAHRSTLYAGMLAWQRLPEALETIGKKPGTGWSGAIQHPGVFVKGYMQRSYELTGKIVRGESRGKA